MVIHAKIPVVIQKANGVEQTFWVSFDNFKRLKSRGIGVRRVDSTGGPSVLSTTGKFSRQYEDQFIQDFTRAGKAGIKLGPDTFTGEMTAVVDIKKNGETIRKLAIKLNKEKIARAVLENIQLGK